MRMEAELGVMQLLAEECQGLLEYMQIQIENKREASSENKRLPLL